MNYSKKPVIRPIDDLKTDFKSLATMFQRANIPLQPRIKKLFEIGDTKEVMSLLLEDAIRILRREAARLGLSTRAEKGAIGEAPATVPTPSQPSMMSTELISNQATRLKSALEKILGNRFVVQILDDSQKHTFVNESLPGHIAFLIGDKNNELNNAAIQLLPIATESDIISTLQTSALTLPPQ